MNNLLEKKLISSFSRRVGRTLSDTQKSFLKEKLPKYVIRDLNKLDLKKLFPFDYEEIWFEIGFGSGEHIAELADKNRNIAFIGCEPFLNGVANLLNQIEDRQIENIKIWQNDARFLLEQLPDNSLNRVYILFPDPWPKLKHHKRRIISQATLDLLSSKLNDNGKLVIATDHKEYASEIDKTLKAHTKFKSFSDNYNTPPEGWVKTKYQEKAEALNLKPYFFQYLLA